MVLLSFRASSLGRQNSAGQTCPLPALGCVRTAVKPVLKSGNEVMKAHALSYALQYSAVLSWWFKLWLSKHLNYPTLWLIWCINSDVKLHNTVVFLLPKWPLVPAIDFIKVIKKFLTKTLHIHLQPDMTVVSLGFQVASSTVPAST